MRKIKYKILIGISIIFFLFVNTTYFWETPLGAWAIPIFLIELGLYAGLMVALLWLLYKVVVQTPGRRQRLIAISIITSVLLLVYYRPQGLIDFTKYEAADVLIAAQEGTANCRTTLRLKADHTFKERSVCFGIEETTGTYRIQNGTIYFSNIYQNNPESKQHAFALIRPSKYAATPMSVVYLKHAKDSIGYELGITKMN